MVWLVFVGALGMSVGVLAGALGTGGGIILAPLLLYGPPIVGFAPLEMKTVTGLTMAQGVATGFVGTVVHNRARHVHPELAITVGLTLAVASFAGAVASSHVPSQVLLGIFAAVAFAAGGMMLVPCAGADREAELSEVRFSRLLAVGAALAIGALGGLIGQSGAFILSPLMIYVLGVPTRVTIGTTLAVVLCAAIAGTAGKAVAGQLGLASGAALCAGAAIGTALGARLNSRIPARSLRLALGVVILVTAVRMTSDLTWPAHASTGSAGGQGAAEHEEGSK